jgi:sigma-E factor negative regulatory protein RseA
MVMNENISRLMDGDLSDADFERCCGELKSAAAIETWACYHAIGDHLRGGYVMSRVFSARFATTLAAEPTILAPAASRGRTTQPGTFAWAVAATLAAITVVGYTAYSMVDAPPSAVAKAREAATMRAAQVTPPMSIPADYLLAHQEYSPATTIQGVGPYVRAVAATAVQQSPSAPQTTR